MSLKTLFYPKIGSARYENNGNESFGILQYYLIEERDRNGFSEELNRKRKKAQMVFLDPK
jgi:hypothetical protein